MEKAKAIKILKKCGWGVLAIVLLFTIVMIVASPVVKHIINTHGEEWIGREIHVDRVIVNPFTGGITLKGFTCKEADGETDFVSFDKLYVRVAYPRLIGKNVKIRSIKLDGFDGQVQKYDSTMNFSDIITYLMSSEEPEDSTKQDEPSSWTFSIDDIEISNSAIRYHDTVNGKQWHLEDIALNIPGLYFDNKKTKAGIEFGLASGGKVGIQAGYRMQSSHYDVELNMQDVHSDILMPFVEDYLDGKEVETILNGSVQVIGNLDDLSEMKFGGDLTMNDVHFSDPSGTYEWDYALRHLHITGNNMSEDGITRISVDALSGTDGTLQGEFVGDPDMTKRDTKISLKLRGVEIADFDALCRNYTGYPIEQGTLLLESNMDVVSGKLTGTNRIEIDHPRIGKRERGTKAPHKNIPVRMGFKTLTSAKDMILLDVPVQGDVTNPKFSFRKVIGRALAKVFFGPLMGLNDRDKSLSAEELREMNELLGEDSVLFRVDTVRQLPADVAVPTGDSIVLPEVSEE